MNKFLLTAASALLLAGNAAAATVGDTYTQVSSTSDLEAGSEYILCYETNAMGALYKTSGSYCTNVAGGISLDGTTATIEKADVVAFTLVDGTAAGTYAIQLPGETPSYLACAKADNGNLGSSADLTANCNLTITVADGVATIIPTENSNNGACKIQYNTGSPRFTNYKTGTQKNCTLYKKAASVDPSLKDAEIAYSEATVSVVLGQEWTAPVLTKATDAEITYTSSDDTVATVDVDGVVTLVAPGETVITATAEANSEYRGGHASYTLTVIDPDHYVEASLYTLVTDLSQLTEGAHVLFVGENSDKYYTMSTASNNNNRKSVEVTVTDGKITTDSEELVLKLGKDGDYWTFETLNYLGTNGYLQSVTSKNNYLNVKASTENSYNADCAKAALTMTDGALSVVFQGEGERKTLQMNYNSGTPLFACYASASQKPVSLYIESKGGTTAVEAVEVAEEAAPVYFNLQGVRVANPEKGLYIKVQGGKSTKVIL